MASAHIEIGSTRHAAELRSFLNTLQATVDRARAIKAGYDQIAAGGDFEALAGRLGLPEVGGDGENNAEPDAATAEAVYNLMGSVAQTLTTDAFVAQMLSRMT